MSASISNRYAFFKGEIVPVEQAKVSIMTSAFNYGTGIFEGIRAYWNEDEEQLYLFRLREHLERFVKNGCVLLIELPYTVERLCEITIELLQREAFQTDVYVRPLAYKSSEAVGVRLHDLQSECAIFAIPFGEYIDRQDGARVMVSSWRRLDDNAIPPRNKITGAYVNSALAKTEASLNGFDDALMLCHDGQISEASAANLFIVRNGQLITPPLTANILEGITRATAIQLALDLGVETLERTIDRSEVYLADEVFLCGTAVGLVPVVEVDRRPIGDGSVGPIAARLRTLYLEAARGRESRYREWCTPVYGKTTGLGMGR